MAMNNVLICGRNLRPAFAGLDNVTGVDIDIDDTSIVGVIGHDMQLKSGWLKVLAGIESLYSGHLQVFGQDVARMSKPEWQSMRVNLAYLNHETMLLSVLNTLENILLPSLYHKLERRDELVKRAHELLAAIEFEDMGSLNSLPAYIKDYEYCQAIIVRALLLQPRILIMDNIFRKLDAASADKLMNFTLQYVKSHGIALLFHTSKLDFALEYTNRILFVMQRCVLHFNDREDIKVSGNADVIKYLKEHYVN